MTTRASVALLVVLWSLTLAAAGNGSLKVTSFPSGAEVWVDGADTGKVTPMSISLTEGDHTVTVRLPGTGWNPDTRIVTIVAGNNDLSVTLLPTITAGPPGPAGPGGAPANVRPAGPAECATSGIVVTSGDGLTSAPVCNGAQGPQGSQGMQGIQGNQGIQGIQGDPGPAGAPASVRQASSTECATGGIVVTSGNGEVSLPVCNGDQGPQGLQGVQGVQGAQGQTGAPGPPGPPGSAPAVDPATLVGFADNLFVDIGSGYRTSGVSPVYVEVDALGDTSRGYSPGKIHVAPFVIAARRPVDDFGPAPPDLRPELAAWFDLARVDHIAARRTIRITLKDAGFDDNLTVELADCVPTTLDTDFADVVRVLVRCVRANSVTVVGGEANPFESGDSLHLPAPLTIQPYFLALGQYVTDVAGGGTRLISEGPSQHVETDPVRLRAGSVRSGVSQIGDWITASLAIDAPGKFNDVELVDAHGAVVAQYSDMFLTYIGLIDPSRTIMLDSDGRLEPWTFIRIGFDLVMRVGRP